MIASESIGVLDLQGGVSEHLEHLARLGVPARAVKHARDFAGLAGLIIPGGESSCLSRLLRIFELDTVIRAAHAAGTRLWGTCAGAILLANEVAGEEPHLALLDVGVERNAFGSQLASFNTVVSVPTVSAKPIPLTFIRAPKIHRVGAGVQVLLEVGDYVAAVESDSVLATVFHPELTPSTAFHAYFARKCGLHPQAPTEPEGWQQTSWTKFSAIP
jgi:5'-phosphate synthase pdxT subunit